MPDNSGWEQAWHAELGCLPKLTLGWAPGPESFGFGVVGLRCRRVTAIGQKQTSENRL